MDKEIDFNLESREILKIFRYNIIKSSIISELKKDHITSAFEGTLTEEISSLQKGIGIENIARDQAIVMIASSFEAFMKDFFRLMVTREDLLKNALRECETLKIKSKDIIKLFNDKISWGDIIINEEKLSFQRFNSLCRCSKMIGFSFEDIVEDTAKELNRFIIEESNGKVTLPVSGCDFFNSLFNMRHKIVHESSDIPLTDFEFRNYLIFFQFLAQFIRNKFFSESFDIISRHFEHTNKEK